MDDRIPIHRVPMNPTNYETLRAALDRSTPRTPATVAHRCALCSEVLSHGDLTPNGADAVTAAHHAVCPARPIEVGETVRIVRTTWDAMHGIHGTVIAIDRHEASMPYMVRADDGRGLHDWWCFEVERIPRPAEAQAPVPHGYVEHRCQGSLANGEQCPRRTTATNVRIDEWQCPDCVARGIVVRAAPAPAPTLVDGLDREVCLARWMENRLAIESGAPPPNALTPEQVATGRAMWLQRFGAQRSDALRAKVTADREAERCRVRVDLEYAPWE